MSVGITKTVHCVRSKFSFFFVMEKLCLLPSVVPLLPEAILIKSPPIFSVLSLSFLLSPLFFWIRFILHLFVSTILAVDCGVLSSPLNGSSSGNRTVYPNSVRLWCDSGFVLHGSWLRTCQSNGKWDGNETICEGKKPGSEIAPHYAFLRLLCFLLK